MTCLSVGPEISRPKGSSFCAFLRCIGVERAIDHLFEFERTHPVIWTLALICVVFPVFQLIVMPELASTRVLYSNTEVQFRGVCQMLSFNWQMCIGVLLQRCIEHAETQAPALIRYSRVKAPWHTIGCVPIFRVLSSLSLG